MMLHDLRALTHRSASSITPRQSGRGPSAKRSQGIDDCALVSTPVDNIKVLPTPRAAGGGSGVRIDTTRKNANSTEYGPSQKKSRIEKAFDKTMSHRFQERRLNKLGNMIKDSKVKDHMKVYEDTYHREKLPAVSTNIQRLLAKNIRIESVQDAKSTARDPTTIASERRSTQKRASASSLGK